MFRIPVILIENLLGFGAAIVVESIQQAAQDEGVFVTWRSLLGPGDDLLEGLAPAVELSGCGDLLQARDAGLSHRRRRGRLSGQRQGRRRFPQMAETLGIAGHGGVQDLADLATEHGVLVNEVAAMAPQELQGAIVVGPGGFEQTEAVGGGAEDGRQIRVVGLTPAAAGWRYCLEVNGWTRRVSKPAWR